MKQYFAPHQEDAYKSLIEEEGGISIWSSFEQFDPVVFIKGHVDEFRIEYDSEDILLPRGADMDVAFSPILVLSNALREKVSCLVGCEHLKDLNLRLPASDLVACYLDLVICNALDKEKSEYDEYDNGFVVFKHVLRREAIGNLDVFRLNESPNRIFVSSSFVDLFKSGGFKGITFRNIEAY